MEVVSRARYRRGRGGDVVFAGPGRRALINTTVFERRGEDSCRAGASILANGKQAPLGRRGGGGCPAVHRSVYAD